MSFASFSPAPRCFISFLRRPLRTTARRALGLLLVAGLAPVGAGEEVTPTPPTPVAPPAIEQMEEFNVSSSRADVEVWPEEQRDLEPFGNEGVFGDFQMVDDTPDAGANLVAEELANLPAPQISEFASVSGAGTPRGFTTPRLRNGITQLGFPEQIVGGRRDLLTGFLAVLYGRTAPGGIVNLISRRP